MADKGPVTIRSRKFVRNALLARRQMVSVQRLCPQPPSLFPCHAFVCMRIHSLTIPHHCSPQIIDVLHPGRANVPKAELQEIIAGVSFCSPHV